MISNEDEDLEVNPVMVTLKLKAPDLYRRAADEQLLVCIPCAASSQGLPLNRTTLETHLLKPSPFFAGLYESMNGKTVEVEEGMLETRSGFLDNRRVRILFEELHYNENFKPFRVVCISQPLQGGVRPLEDRKRGKDAQAQVDTMEQCKTFLYALHLVDISPMTRAKTSIREFFHTYRIFAKGYLGHVTPKLCSLFDQVADELIRSNRDRLEDYSRGGKKWSMFRRSVEVVLMEDTKLARKDQEVGVSRDSEDVVNAHEKLYLRLRDAYKEEDARIERAITLLKSDSVKDFGADPVLEKCDFAGPVKLLRDFQKLPCALDKASTLKDVTNAIHASVLEAIEKGRVPEQTKIGSDDLLPLFIFALVQASPRCIYSNAELLQHFTSFGSMDSEISFHAANLRAAADFLLQSASHVKQPSRYTPSTGVPPEEALTDEGLELPGLPATSKPSKRHSDSTLPRQRGIDQNEHEKSSRKPSDPVTSTDVRKAGPEETTQKLPTRSLTTRQGSLNSFGAIKDEEEEMQLGEFLLALKSEDLPTSSGRGVPF
uniref:VPS9 domain-containing protein n=1 Tax=Guillardia theta TaxID=55529 RepID=A0A7S4UDD0_GUITH|mmetsp:Transcript_6464/g.23018  ORF Transcript_6464/g.23018 Transcript_6464/m.23018 type:complete len:544 (+) Transcript_6464:187-1818(+)